jgi:hypothetical protein
MVKHVASLQEALAASDYIQLHGEIDRSFVPIRPNDHETLSYRAMRVRFQLPCDLLPSFYPVAQSITAGSCFIHSDGGAGALWDATSENAIRKTWTPQLFFEEWKSSILPS